MTISAPGAQTFSPADADVTRYRQVRDALRTLHSRIVATVPRAALDEMGDRLGLRGEDGVLIFPFEDAASVLMEACLYAWAPKGESLVAAFAQPLEETGEPAFSDLDLLVLRAATLARHRVFRIVEVVPGAGVGAVDGRTGESFFLMDESLSRHPGAVGHWFTSRLIPVGPWEMTTGAALDLGAIPEPLMSDLLEDVCKDDATTEEIATAFTVLGLELAAEAGYEVSDRSQLDQSELPARRPGRNQPCPCGSGRKYKRCCWS